MATREALQIREEQVVIRLQAAVTALAKGAGIGPPTFEVLPTRRNQKTSELARLEIMADFLESLETSPAPGKATTKPKAKPKK